MPRTIPIGYTDTLEFTMAARDDNASPRFIKLTARSPETPAPLEAYIRPDGTTVGDWEAAHPGYRMQSYRAVPPMPR